MFKKMTLVGAVLLSLGLVGQASADAQVRYTDACSGVNGQWVGTYNFINSNGYFYYWNANAAAYNQGNDRVHIDMTISNCRTSGGENCHNAHPKTYFIEGSCKDGRLILDFAGINSFGSIQNDVIDFSNHNNHIVLHKQS